MFTLVQALEVIKNKTEFKHNSRNGYSVIDYFVTTKDTFVGSNEFETMILCNLRGTCFDENGNISRLGFEKFMNLNQCSGYMEKDIDFSEPHDVLEKLDGSAIFQIKIGNSYRLGTRAGVTDYSDMAEEFIRNSPIRHRYDTFISSCTFKNKTAIFEFTSRKNKVVVDYPEDNLTLLAIRCNVTGDYEPYENLKSKAPHLPVVRRFANDKTELAELSSVVRALDSTLEGVVITFASGFHVKIKGDEYVRKHSCIDMIRFEKSILKMILENTIDDVLPLLEEKDKNKIIAYSESVLTHISHVELDVMSLYEQNKHLARKEYAEMALSHSKIKNFLFSAYVKKPLCINEFILKNTGSQTQVDSVRELIGPSFYSF